VRSLNWTVTDTRYAIATALACLVAGWITLGAFGVGPSPLPRIATDPAPRLAGLAFEDVEESGSPGTQTPTFTVTPPILDPEPGPTPVLPEGDTQAPEAAFTTEDGDVLLAVPGPALVTGTASDTGSGVASVEVTFTPATGQARTVAASLDCASGDRACTWTAGVPDAGAYDVTVTSTDHAGNASDPMGPITITAVQLSSDDETATADDDAELARLVGELTSVLGLG